MLCNIEENKNLWREREHGKTENKIKSWLDYKKRKSMERNRIVKKQTRKHAKQTVTSFTFGTAAWNMKFSIGEA